MKSLIKKVSALPAKASTKGRELSISPQGEKKMRQVNMSHMLVASTAILLFSPSIADAKAPAAQDRLKELYTNQLGCLEEAKKSRACSGLESAYSSAGFGDLQEDAAGGNDPPPPAWPSVDWDNFLVPNPAVTLENFSVGSASGVRFKSTEHDLTVQTGTLRNFNIRYTELTDGSVISQVGKIGEGQVVYERNSSLGTARNDFFELQYDNATGSGGVGGSPFDITGAGQFDTMVLHFKKLVASTKYVAGDVELEGSRVCVHAYLASGDVEPVAPYWSRSDAGSFCGGTVLESGDDIELVITYTEYFRLSSGYEFYCTLVEDGSISPEDFFSWFGTSYEEACLVEIDLSGFAEMRALLVYVDGADEVVIDKITLQKRQ